MIFPKHRRFSRPVVGCITHCTLVRLSTPVSVHYQCVRFWLLKSERLEHLEGGGSWKCVRGNIFTSLPVPRMLREEKKISELTQYRTERSQQVRLITTVLLNDNVKLNPHRRDLVHLVVVVVCKRLLIGGPRVVTISLSVSGRFSLR